MDHASPTYVPISFVFTIRLAVLGVWDFHARILAGKECIHRPPALVGLSLLLEMMRSRSYPIAGTRRSARSCLWKTLVRHSTSTAYLRQLIEVAAK